MSIDPAPEAPRTFQTAVITGASSGIGEAFARALDPATALLLTGRDESRLKRLADELNAASGRARVTWTAADLAQTGGRTAVIERARIMQPDLLVCAAGMSWSGNFLDQTSAQLREIVEVNVLAVVEMLHALLPGMTERAREAQRRAAAIVVSSSAAFAPEPEGVACYAASKTFELRLAQGLARELRDQPVDVLTLCPTYTATAFFERAGLPVPPEAMQPAEVAQQALAAVGKRTLHVCSLPDLRRPLLTRIRAFPGKALKRVLRY